MLKFAQKSFWSNLIFVMKEGRKVGEIRMGMLGEQTLKLESGERFFLYASFWEQEAYWKSEAGETVVRYRQAFMSAMSRGEITAAASLPSETKNLLVGSGLLLRSMMAKRRALTVAILLPIIASASR